MMVQKKGAVGRTLCSSDNTGCGIRGKDNGGFIRHCRQDLHRRRRRLKDSERGGMTMGESQGKLGLDCHLFFYKR